MVVVMVLLVGAAVLLWRLVSCMMSWLWKGNMLCV